MRLEKPHKDDGVGQVGNLNILSCVTDHAMLCHRQKRRGTASVQVLQQLVQMQDEVLLLRHGGAISVEAVDADGQDLLSIDALANPMGEFAWRKFCGVHL